MLKYIDTFYFIFRKFISLKTYRYAFCGGSNLVFDTILYFIFFHFIFDKQHVDLYIIVMSPHIASLFFVFPITFISGFILSKYITFRTSNVATKIQFIRYLIVGSGALLLNYILMKFLVDFLKLFPTPSRLLTIIITIIYSYILQNNFSFKTE